MIVTIPAWTQEHWQEINRAYKALVDPQKRVRVDRAVEVAAKAKADELAAREPKRKCKKKGPKGKKEAAKKKHPGWSVLKKMRKAEKARKKPDVENPSQRQSTVKRV